MWVIREKTIKTLRPLEARNSFDWICANIRTPDGKPFKWFDYPWTRGICNAWDNPDVRQVTLQFAARLGKTFLANALIISALEHDPCMGMIALPTEPLLRDMIRDKYYPMLERCFATKDLIPAKAFRTQTRIDMATSVVYGAWSGSPSTLADKAPKVKHGGEVDKMDKSTSDEADPLDLFLERGIEIPDRKTLIESTPSITGQSRIEHHLISGWNCRFMVPCPLCKERIELFEGAEGQVGGIQYDKLPDGKHDIMLAKKTARYQCQECGKEWGDDKRRTAILAGEWVPAGMRMNKRGKLEGEMLGDPENASYQLSRIYAPTFTFGDIAGAIASCHINPSKWHNVRNSWFGKTYQRRRATKEWDEVGTRLKMDYTIGTIPASGAFLTVGIDVQQDHFVYVVSAWGHDSVGWIVDYGLCHSVLDVRKMFHSRYEHLDGGPTMGISIGLMDAGEGVRQDEVIDLCRDLNKPNGPWLWPSKGSSGVISGGRPYRQQTFEEIYDKKKRTHRVKKGLKGFFFIGVNTPHWQSWIQSALHYRKPGEPKSIAIPIEAEQDEDFLRQLVNERPEDSTDMTGHSKTKWFVVDETVPVDFRDATRYARCAAEVFTRGAWGRVKKSRTLSAADRQQQNTPTAKESRRSPKKPSVPKTPGRQGFVRSPKSNRFLSKG